MLLPTIILLGFNIDFCVIRLNFTVDNKKNIFFWGCC